MNNSPTQPGDFSNQADAYARSRPGYPPQLLNDLLHTVAARPGDPVADLGAGTGIFTAMLAQRGLRVTAVEPNNEMRANAQACSSPGSPAVAWINGTFENTTLPAGSQRWATAAQSFHWADPARALPEIHRILQPAGCFTILWNNRQNSENPVTAWTHEAILKRHAGFNEHYREHHDWPAVLLSTGHFERVVEHSHRHVVPMTRDRFIDLWRSHNQLNARMTPAAFADFIHELTAHLIAEKISTVHVPYLCRSWTVWGRGK